MIGLLIFLILFDPDELIENPVDINHASYYEISQIPFLRDDQINLILKTRPFKNFGDLISKTQLDPITASLIRDYIYFSPTVLKRAGAGYAHTDRNYLDLYLKTEKSVFSFNLRDSLAKYRFSYRSGDMYIGAGTILPRISKFSEKPYLSSSYSAEPGLFAEYRGLSLFYSKDRYLVVTPTIYGFSGFLSKTNTAEYGAIFRSGHSLSKVMLKLSFIKKPVFGFAAYRKIKKSYFSAGFTYSRDTIGSSVYFSTLVPLNDLITLKMHSRTYFDHMPSTTSYFELYFPADITVRYRVYNNRTNILSVENPLSFTDTLSLYIKFADRSKYGINVELTHRSVSGGFTLITTDEPLSIRERGIRSSGYVSCSAPFSDVYLTARQSIGGFNFKVKFSHGKSSGFRFHFGGSYTWQL